MDYSKFVTAIVEEDQDALNAISPIISKVLIKFLIVRMGAEQLDAEDSVQNTLLLTIQKIKNDKLKNPDTIIYYMFTTAKNDYLKQLSKKKESIHDGIADTYFENGDQLERLLDNERQKILQYCLSKLKKDHKTYISYWLENPEDEASDVASRFGISVNNAWTKKHRIIQLLKECVNKNIAL